MGTWSGEVLFVANEGRQRIQVKKTFVLFPLALELLAAKKTRALYATKLLIELPLVGLCALNAWAHWGDCVRASAEPEDVLYALLFAWFAGGELFKLCWGDMVKLERAARDCFKLYRALPSDEAGPHLGWDSEDEASLAEQHELVKQDFLWGLAFGFILFTGLAVSNRVSPNPSDDKLWGHALFLSLSVYFVGEFMFGMCTCLALEGRKWAVRKWGS
ncbi:hypothetical protein KFL_005190050 [Klebsormidium nitens]|uniref:Uncharacterized protein n=1 Tax=Klebsormidium nitens TaxID=105231 RepID=A0A1Y1IFL2_KLENI|nr:hypothetical protein KFL_005190050 [Klebsormidium nitens]|eukprot:GAQ89413.1 hypothetical protein KFL_005190050 [Klebsormidium nitens]